MKNTITVLFLANTLALMSCSLGSDGDKSFYVADNGVTVKCENADVGETGTAGGSTYTKRSADQITPSNAETTCTSGITDMSEIFFEASDFNGDISS